MDALNNTRRCTGCRRILEASAFASATTSRLFRTWIYCLYRQTPRTEVSPSDMISPEDVGQHYPKIELIEVDGIDNLFVEYKYEEFIECLELGELAINNAADNRDEIKRIVKQTVSLVESCDCYSYYVRDIGEPIMQRLIHFSAYTSAKKYMQKLMIIIMFSDDFPIIEYAKMRPCFFSSDEICSESSEKNFRICRQHQ